MGDVAWLNGSLWFQNKMWLLLNKCVMRFILSFLSKDTLAEKWQTGPTYTFHVYIKMFAVLTCHLHFKNFSIKEMCIPYIKMLSFYNLIN